jgi:hypothetical protein
LRNAVPQKLSFPEKKNFRDYKNIFCYKIFIIIFLWNASSPQRRCAKAFHKNFSGKEKLCNDSKIKIF